LQAVANKGGDVHDRGVLERILFEGKLWGFVVIVLEGLVKLLLELPLSF
jgi:hypothetical protein